MVDMAINGADFAEKIVKKAGEALSDLRETMLECSNLRAGKTLVTWPKGH